MRQQHTIDKLSGANENPVAGTTLKISWNFTSAGVQVGDVVENKTQGTSGTVQSITDANNLVADISFQQGDFFEITLSTSYQVASNLGLVYENICRRCGKQCTTDEMQSHDGFCKECYDEPHPTDPE